MGIAIESLRRGRVNPVVIGGRFTLVDKPVIEWLNKTRKTFRANARLGREIAAPKSTTSERFINNISSPGAFLDAMIVSREFLAVASETFKNDLRTYWDIHLERFLGLKPSFQQCIIALESPTLSPQSLSKIALQATRLADRHHEIQRVLTLMADISIEQEEADRIRGIMEERRTTILENEPQLMKDLRPFGGICASLLGLTKT